jgi:hypothetical protein
VSPAREPDDDRHGDNWHWDDPFAPGGGDRPPGVRSSTFDELIEGWRREGRVPEWPDEPEPDDRDDRDNRDGRTERAAAPAAEPTDAPGSPDDSDDDHYVPPEPPPLPKLGAPAVVGLGLLGLGLLLLVAPWWIGVSETFAIPLGLLALASGLGWLVLRLWPAPPPTGDGDGEDDGAVI